jgi:hypothetical protein
MSSSARGMLARPATTASRDPQASMRIFWCASKQAVNGCVVCRVQPLQELCVALALCVP